MIKTLINVIMLMSVFIIYASIFKGVEYALHYMMMPDLVFLIWFLLWLPAVFSATILTSHLLI